MATNRKLEQLKKANKLIERTSPLHGLPALKHAQVKSLSSENYMAECNKTLTSLLQCWSVYEIPNAMSQSPAVAYQTGNAIFDETVTKNNGNVGKSQLVQGGNNQARANKCTELMNELIHCVDGKYNLRSDQNSSMGVGIKKHNNVRDNINKSTEEQNALKGSKDSVGDLNTVVKRLYTRITGNVGGLNKGKAERE
ncbi:hypothetical protein HANVADRAFT_61296 [Hanseniaspora valbyensis NRRL Y-1626]|uniref:Uncharacterized protein n=1 Tax=Hanseniaspora valbyensis NRRL Y-1626 TaxID=766949 RepID=A0A1B7THY9_9ASCO|nr:hypothetical protein HANVADRAFT_61296 [Hanseniaspora valbyensis NRRL Y-1626]